VADGRDKFRLAALLLDPVGNVVQHNQESCIVLIVAQKLDADVKGHIEQRIFKLGRTFVPFYHAATGRADRFAGFESLPDSAFGPLLYPLYFERFGVLVKRATDDLSFGRADEQVAARLKLKPGDPLAIIRRTAFDIDGTPVEWRIARGSAAQFHYRSEIG
jgi:DNA-binding GntR family transcriptional regulator